MTTLPSSDCLNKEELYAILRSYRDAFLTTEVLSAIGISLMNPLQALEMFDVAVFFFYLISTFSHSRRLV